MTRPPVPAASSALIESTCFESEQAPTTMGLARGIPIYVVFKSAMVHLSFGLPLGCRYSRSDSESRSHFGSRSRLSRRSTSPPATFGDRLGFARNPCLCLLYTSPSPRDGL